MAFVIIVFLILIIIFLVIKIEDFKNESERLLTVNKNLVFKIDEKENEIKNLSNRIENQKNEIKNFNKNITDLSNNDIEVLKRDYEVKTKIIKDKDNTIKYLNEQLENVKQQKTIDNSNLEKEKKELISEISTLKKDIKLLESKNLSIYLEKILFDEPYELNSDELKNQLSILKLEQKQFMQDDKAIKNVSSKYTEKAVERNNKKQLLTCFETECSNIFQNLKFNNIDKSREKLIKTFNNLNNIFKTDDINLSEEFLNLKLKEFAFLIEIAKKTQEEKEIQKAIKEQLIEEEKVRKEIEREKLKIEKEEKQFNNEVSKMLAYLQKADNDIEKELYANKIKELEEKIKLLEKDKENVLQRETNTRAGFVYIISNIGSFGEDIFKIGMTRRLEPMDRISELSSASVPFPFDVHAIIFSEDAPTLENSIHKYFQDKSVNKVNLRKEFFKIDVKELKSYILNDLNQNVDFVEIPKAEQYRESLKISEV